MPKKLLGTNCKIRILPQGWTAKIDDKGTALINVPDNLAGEFVGTFLMMAMNLKGFQAMSFDTVNNLCLVGAPAGYDESGFHDF